MKFVRICPVTVFIFQMLSQWRVPVTLRQSVRSVYTVTETNNRALVLGVVWGKESFTLTLSGWKLVERLAAFGNAVGGGEARYLGSVHPDLSPHVIAVGLDKELGVGGGECGQREREHQGGRRGQHCGWLEGQDYGDVGPLPGGHCAGRDAPPGQDIAAPETDS